MNPFLHRCLAAGLIAAGLAGCIAGTSGSSRPVYPANWPALGGTASGQKCPDLSGTYRAESEAAGPLVYPRGGRPQEMFLLVPVGAPEPSPRLGRRLLVWHLAGEFARTAAIWSELEAYAATAATSSRPSGEPADASWVRIRMQPGAKMEVVAGAGSETLLRFDLVRAAPGFWTYRTHRYECRDGGLVIYSGFPPPAEENPTGVKFPVGAKCTFYRGTDGSLIMLEEAYTGVPQGTMLFSKWWRWLPLPPAAGAAGSGAHREAAPPGRPGRL